MLSKKGVASEYKNSEWKETKRPGHKVTVVTDPSLKNRFKQQQKDLAALRVSCDDTDCCACEGEIDSW